MITAQFPALVVVTPLILALFAFISGWVKRPFAFFFATVALGVSLFASAFLLGQVMATGPISYRMADWVPPMGIEYYVDHLSALVLVVVSAIAFINLIATKADAIKCYGKHLSTFYSLYLLSVAGHLGIVITGDAFNLYVLLEIAALSGYALLGMGSSKAPLSTLRYLLLGTVGASFYLLGVGYLYIMTGTLNMLDLSRMLPLLTEAAGGVPIPVIGAFGLIMAGAFIKMAFFPLHAWLPSAYTDAASPASSLIAPMTTKVMVYVMIRMVLSVFSPGIAFISPVFNTTIVWAAVVAILAGGLFALASRDLKRMLTFIIVAEVGYMVGGIWLGNPTAMSGAILHIVNDAAMTLCVFLAAGAIAYRTDSLQFKDLKGLFRKQPFTMTAFVIGGLSMIGVPPTCGFFSKWYLVLGGIEAGHFGFVAALIISSLINIVLFFRIFEIAYYEPFGEMHGGHYHGPPHEKIHDAPWSMVAPLLAVAAGLIVLGLYSGDIVTNVIHRII